MSFGKRTMKIVAVSVAVVFVLQMIVGGLGLLAPTTVSAAGCTSYPCSNSIEVLAYNGNDQAALSDLNAGHISTYDFQLTPTEAAGLHSGFGTLAVPNSLYEVEINPEQTTWANVTGSPPAFNPFYYPGVRSAINYVLNRAYLVDSILGGHGVPILSVYGVAPDSLTVANATAPYQGYLTYNFALANSTIYSALTANSNVTYVGGHYYYNGKPIHIYMVDRTDDPVRSEYAGYLTTQLTNLGFTVDTEPMNLQIVRGTVFSENPVDGSGGTPPTPWDIYIGAFSNVFLYYGDLLQVCFDGANCAAGPYSDNCGPGDLANGAYNTTAETPADVISLSCQLDKLNNIILGGAYQSIAQRQQVLTNYTRLEIQMGVNDWLATGLNVYGYNPAQITGLSASFVASPVMGTVQTWMTMMSGGTASTGCSSSVQLCLGARYLSQYNMNPVGGYGDAYQADLLAGVLPGITGNDGPSTGYPQPFGWTYTINAANTTGGQSIPVPATAVNYNNATGTWGNVTTGTKAALDATINFANLMNNDKYVDGEPITLGDILFDYELTSNVTNPTSPYYDTVLAGTFASELATIKGMRILNSTAIELYSSYSFFDPVQALFTSLGDLQPGRNVNMPWTMYQAMADVIKSGTDVWTSSTAGKTGKTWLSLASGQGVGSPQDITYLENALSTRGAAGYMPSSLTQLQSLTGVALFPSGYSPTTAFGQAHTFMTTNGNGLIGFGPFYVSTLQASTTPYYAILTKNPYFALGPYLAPGLFAPATTISVSASIGATLGIGSTVPITTLSTLIGQTTATPQSGVNVVVQIVNNSTVVSQTRLVSGSGGVANFVVPSVPPGPYTITMYANSVNSSMIVPQSYSTIIGTSTTGCTGTTCTTTTTTPPTTTSATTSTQGFSGTTLAIIAGVIIVIIVVTAVALFMRRRPR